MYQYRVGQCRGCQLEDETGRTVRRVVLAVGVAIAVLVMVLAVSERGRGSPPLPDFAPEFAGDTLSGDRFEMVNWRGRWVLVNFFATWCVECRVEHPELVAFAQRYQDDPDVRLVSVVFRDSTDRIADFFAIHGGTWPVVVSDTRQVAIDFGVTAVPETYLVDPSGRVVVRFTGGVTLADIQEQLVQAGAVV